MNSNLRKALTLIAVAIGLIFSIYILNLALYPGYNTSLYTCRNGWLYHKGTDTRVVNTEMLKHTTDRLYYRECED